MVDGGDVMHAVCVDAPREPGLLALPFGALDALVVLDAGQQASTATLEIFR